MKGIILAAGKGTRLYPITRPICKPLLPLYDKPLLYYPLSVLMQAGIREILIIVPPDDQAPFEKLLGDGSALGLSLQYREQKVQRGIADAFLVGEDFVAGQPVCLVLGDNVFHGPSLPAQLARARANTVGATVFGLPVEDPRPFGVVEFDQNGRAVSIEEKPQHPKSNFIVPGLYFYDGQAVELARRLTPSARGELEITALNNLYLEQGQLSVVPLDQQVVWFDAGNADSLLDSARAIRDIQRQTGRLVACPEQIAFEQGWITRESLRQTGEALRMTRYGDYLLSL
ncbi:MAG: glucose-1-phosphate thymidylyltransferase [Oscillospiraceae bacterium]|nr:MAG: glucose-1-phosphate thymidylyltransferase [Oscillospiraceae bacterium]